MLVLETIRLILEPITWKHESELHRLHHDPFVSKPIFNHAPVEADTRENLELYIDSWKRYNFGSWIVYEKRRYALKNNIEVVGRSGLRIFSGTDNVEFGHCYLSEHSGQGFGFEAALAVAEFGFKCVGLKKLVAILRPDDTRGLRSIKRIGFQYIDDRLHEEKYWKYLEMQSSRFFGSVIQTISEDTL